jgi:hypothetical protein
MYYVIEHHEDGGQTCVGYRSVFTNVHLAIDYFIFQIKRYQNENRCYCKPIKFGFLREKPSEGFTNKLIL